MISICQCLKASSNASLKSIQFSHINQRIQNWTQHANTKYKSQVIIVNTFIPISESQSHNNIFKLFNFRGKIKIIVLFMVTSRLFSSLILLILINFEYFQICLCQLRIQPLKFILFAHDYFSNILFFYYNLGSHEFTNLSTW